MTAVDLIVLAVLAALVLGAAVYVVRAKKRGVKCIGCPSGCACSRHGEHKEGCGCQGGSSCCCGSHEHS